MPYDKIGRVTYLFCLNVVDVASRYKASIPIGARSVKDRRGILTSSTIAKALEKIYIDPKCPLVWPILLISDKGSEFKGSCEKILKEHGTKFQKAKSKRSIAIVERYNRTLAERLFKPQDACELLSLHLSEIFRVWVENLPIVVDDENNSVTRLLDISPVDAIKKKRVFAKPSKPQKGSMGYDEEKLSYDTSVIYLLDPSEYEGGRRRATDMNWSSKIFQIRESLIQKNQPVLYWLIDDEGNDPERSFVREELQIVPPNVEYPPQWVLAN
jgi:hypothetical protein